jgi:hypothetical protein
MRPSLLARVRGLLATPRHEVVRTIADPGDVGALLVPYVLPLTAVGAVARFVSRGLLGEYHAPDAELFGMQIGGGFVRAPLPAAIGALLSIGVGIGAWLLLAWLLTTTAPRYGARSDAGGARKLAAIILTPPALAGITALFASIPHLTFVEPLVHVAALGYGALLGVWGAPVLVGTPEAKAPAHVLAALGLVVVGLALFVFGMVVAG